MEIVYCGGCGKALHPDDFAKAGACFLDNRPWCADCRPPDKTPIVPAARRSGSSAKHPRVRLAEPSPGPPRGLLIGLALGGVGILIVALAAMARSEAPPPPRPQAAAVRPPPERNSEDLARVLKELESFASLAPADKVSARCEELRPKFKGQPEERRFREIEDAALGQRKDKDFVRELDEIRKLIDADPRFARADEVARRYQAARTLAPGRGAEINARLAEYQKARQASPHEKHAGPFEADDNAFIRNWLFLGPFPNEKDKGLDTDFLKAEADHDPVAGLAVGKLEWTAWASLESKVVLYNVPSLKIKMPKENIVVYAACLLQVAEEGAYEFRVGSDDGEMLWVDGRQILKGHAARKLLVDQDRVSTTLSRGLHRVLLKLDQHSKEFEFALRVLTPEGKRPAGLRIWN
jgi:hypothetical protein